VSRRLQRGERAERDDSPPGAALEVRQGQSDERDRRLQEEPVRGLERRLVGLLRCPRRWAAAVPDEDVEAAEAVDGRPDGSFEVGVVPDVPGDRDAPEPCGVLLYMAQEGRGIGLLNKLKAYELQEQGLDTVDANLALGFAADEREWGIGNQILADLGLTTIRLLTNNPKKVSGLEAYGLKVTEQVPIEVPPHAENLRYLTAKRDRLGHRLHHQDLKFDAEGE